MTETEQAHVVERTAAAPRIIVLCWSYENRLEQGGPLGYSFHLTEEDASEWKKDPAAKLKKHVNNVESGFNLCTLCGEGFVNESPPEELLEALKSPNGAYQAVSTRDSVMDKDTPDWLTLTSGVAAHRVPLKA